MAKKKKDESIEDILDRVEEDISKIRDKIYEMEDQDDDIEDIEDIEEDEDEE